MKNIYKINPEIYPESIILETISDFSEVSEIIYINSELEIIWDDKSEIEEVFNEFMNYLIFNINENN